MRNVVAVLVLLIVSLTASASGTWWKGSSIVKSRDSWLNLAASPNSLLQARSWLRELLAECAADPAGSAASVWLALRSHPDFRRGLEAVLTRSVNDDIASLLVDSRVDASRVLYKIAFDPDLELNLRASAIKALGPAGYKYQDALVKVIVNAGNPLVLRNASAVGLQKGAALNSKQLDQLFDTLNGPISDVVQASVLKLIATHPTPAVVRRISLVGLSRRSGELQVAALQAFITACERASGDEKILAIARRFLAELDRMGSTPMERAATLSAQRWLVPARFDAEMKSLVFNPESWQWFFDDKQAAPFWIDSAFGYNTRRGRTDSELIKEVLKLLEVNRQDLSIQSADLLLIITSHRPGWIVSAIMEGLQAPVMADRRRTAIGIAAIPEYGTSNWAAWMEASKSLTILQSGEKNEALVTSLLARGLGSRSVNERLVVSTLAQVIGIQELEVILLGSRIRDLRESVIESLLGAKHLGSLWEIEKIGTRRQRLQALAILVGVRNAPAAELLASEDASRVVSALFAGPLNRIPKDAAALAEVGVELLKRAVDPPYKALGVSFGEHHWSDDRWRKLWKNLQFADDSNAHAIMKQRLFSLCNARPTVEAQKAWRIIAASGLTDLSESALSRLKTAD